MIPRKLPLKEYYQYRIRKHSIRYLFGLTDSYYPRVLSLGYYDPAVPEIVVATVGKWELRLKHEIGHSEGKKHVPIRKVGYVMHPWGFLRGEKM